MKLYIFLVFIFVCVLPSCYSLTIQLDEATSQYIKSLPNKSIQVNFPNPEKGSIPDELIDNQQNTVSTMQANNGNVRNLLGNAIGNAIGNAVTNTIVNGRGNDTNGLRSRFLNRN